MSSDVADALLELVFAVDGGIADLCAVVVYGVGCVAQQFGDLGAGINTQTDEGKDAEFGGEDVALFGSDACVGSQQRVELVDECRIEGDERLVEVAVEDRHLLAQESVRVFLGLARHARHAVDHVAVHLQIAANILLLDHVTLAELVVELEQLRVQGVEFLVTPVGDDYRDDDCYDHGYEQEYDSPEAEVELLLFILVGAADDECERCDLLVTGVGVEDVGIAYGVVDVAVRSLEVAAVIYLLGNHP